MTVLSVHLLTRRAH